MEYRLIKHNKRLMIVDKDDKVVYCPPNFVRDHIPNRGVMQKLVDDMIFSRDDLGCIMEFESRFHPKSSLIKLEMEKV